MFAASVREQLTNHSAHRGLPFFGIVFGLGQLGEVERGVAERDQGQAVQPSLNLDGLAAYAVGYFIGQQFQKPIVLNFIRRRIESRFRNQPMIV